MSNIARDPPNGRVRRTPTQARQGVTPGIVRHVLAISLTLCIVAFIAVYVLGLRL